MQIGKEDILIYWIDHYICLRRIASDVANSVASLFLQRFQIYLAFLFPLYYLIQYLVQGFPLKADSYCCGKNVAAFLLWNSDVHCSIYKSHPLLPTVTIEFRHLSLRCIYVYVINI